jgi:hypothetical protein
MLPLSFNIDSILALKIVAEGRFKANVLFDL